MVSVMKGLSHVKLGPQKASTCPAHQRRVGLRSSGEDYFVAISENAEPLAYCPRHVPEEYRKPKEKRKKGRPPKNRDAEGGCALSDAKKVCLYECVCMLCGTGVVWCINV